MLGGTYESFSLYFMSITIPYYNKLYPDVCADLYSLEIFCTHLDIASSIPASLSLIENAC